MSRCCALGFLFLSIIAHSNQTTGGLSFGYEIDGNGPVSLRLKTTAFIPTTGMWIGITLTPPLGSGILPVSIILPLKKGRAITELPIGSPMKHGTFEAAIWSRKLPSNQCAIDDKLCAKQGYKLTDMKLYIWGPLSWP